MKGIDNMKNANYKKNIMGKYVADYYYNKKNSEKICPRKTSRADLG